MSIKYGAAIVALVGSVSCVLAAAGEGNGALLKFKVSSEGLPEAGVAKRAGLESAVLVAFNEKFVMQATQFRVELTAVNEPSSAGVTVTLSDARSEPPVLIGTEQVNVPVAGSTTAHMTGADGTTYAVSLQFKRAQLPTAKPQSFPRDSAALELHAGET